MTRHFIKFSDLTLKEHVSVLARAVELKKERFKKVNNHLGGRSIGLLFNKNSTRTRVSFEAGISELGGNAIFMTDGQTQFSRGEPIEHSAKVLSRYLGALVIRTFDQAPLQELAAHGSIPVINGLTDQQHPCQVLTDLFTIGEKLGFDKWESLKVSWIGDGNNMANSWIEAAGLFGFSLTLACPEGYDPDEETLKANRLKNPAITLTREVKKAAEGSHAINTDVWASMGQEAESLKRLKAFADYQVNRELMARAADQAIFLHCLPAHIGEEVTAEVLESPASVIFDQAENRLHAQKALMEFLIPPLV